MEPLLTPNSQKVLANRYLLRNEQGELLECPADLFRRVAHWIAQGDFSFGASNQQVEQLAESFYQMLAQLEFLPNSPTLMNAGRPLGQLSACFVLPIEDSIESIFETLKHTAIIHQSGGGTGFSFSHLRPKNDVVRSTMGVSSGPVSFLEVYNAATEAIKQGGTRRGANMGILRVDHPDIETFIHCKNDLHKITNFNISVAITHEFMAAAQQDLPFTLKHPATGDSVKTLSAKQLLNQIIKNAWKTGEPGLIFIDTINADNPTPTLGAIEATNPCGEVPLLPYEACNLGSINLGKMVTLSGEIDWERLTQTIHRAVHFLENVITQNRFPLPQIEQMVQGNRKIGLGVMGWADCLIQLKLSYASEEALNLAHEVAAWIDYQSKRASVELAKQRGAFPQFAHSRFRQQPGWLREKRAQHPTQRVSLQNWAKLEDEIQQHGLRHATTTCIAPTGTISMIAGASGGIEPLFGIAFVRNVLEGTQLLEVHPVFETTAKAQGFYHPALIEQLLQRGSIQGMSEIPPAVQSIFVTAQDISPASHIKMQAAFQAFTDNGVSKTINFPEATTPDEVAEAYWLAHQQGLKGVTIYRNNSRPNQPMAFDPSPTKTILLCPQCQVPLNLSGGCSICPNCASSPCG